MERLFGLIGFPLSHSFSARYFSEKFKKEDIPATSYRNFPLESISLFPELLSDHPNLSGLNITIPYKESIIPFLDYLSPEAKSIGAVNTIKITRNKTNLTTTGFNTDVYGFEKSLLLNHLSPRKALILGTGGASKAVGWVLKNMGAIVYFATRNPSKSDHLGYHDISGSDLNEFDLVINSTPLGMHPHIEQCPPLPYDELSGNQAFFDLIYNPAETLFLYKARMKKCKTINGLYMLEQQAEKAWKIWNNQIY